MMVQRMGIPTGWPTRLGDDGKPEAWLLIDGHWTWWPVVANARPAPPST
jgi:hypothetical protein